MSKKKVPINKIKAALEWVGVRRFELCDESNFMDHPLMDLRWSIEGTCLTFRVDDRSVLYFVFNGAERGASVVSVTLSSALKDGGMMTVNLSDFPSGELVARALMEDDVSREGVMTVLRWRNTVLNALHEHKKARE